MTFGTSVGGFGRIDVRSSSPLDYHIVRYADYASTIPGAPPQLPSRDPRLSALTSSAHAARTNLGAFDFRAGRYFLTYACAGIQRFQMVEVASRSRGQVFRIGCDR